MILCLSIVYVCSKFSVALLAKYERCFILESQEFLHLLLVRELTLVFICTLNHSAKEIKYASLLIMGLTQRMQISHCL